MGRGGKGEKIRKKDQATASPFTSSDHMEEEGKTKKGVNEHLYYEIHSGLQNKGAEKGEKAAVVSSSYSFQPALKEGEKGGKKGEGGRSRAFFNRRKRASQGRKTAGGYDFSREGREKKRRRKKKKRGANICPLPGPLLIQKRGGRKGVVRKNPLKFFKGNIQEPGGRREEEKEATFVVSCEEKKKEKAVRACNAKKEGPRDRGRREEEKGGLRRQAFNKGGSSAIFHQGAKK